jgi:acyl-CoA synthetase (AMP-forming)/AMP-acid ligase II
MSGFDVETLYGRRATDRWNRMVVGDILERLTWSRPDQDAIIAWPGAYGDERFARVSYAEADAYANQIAQALLAAGLRRGDRVLLLCENSVEAVLTLFGVAKAGLVAAPVNPMMAPDMVTALIEQVQPAFAVVDAELWPVAEPAFEAAGLAPDVTITVGGRAVAGTPEFAHWIADMPAVEADVEVHADDVWALLFTSGTTALPKASMVTSTYSYGAAFSYAMSLNKGLRFETDLRVVTFLPIIYHCGHNAALFPTFLAGGTVVLGRRPDPAGTAGAITMHRPTALWAGSPQFLALIADVAEAAAGSAGSAAHPERIDLSSLTVAMFSWGAMPPPLADRWKRLCGAELGLLEVFGQTEAMSCYRFWLDEHPEKYRAGAPAVNYVGVPNPLLGATVMAEDGTILRDRPGEPGEAVYRSPVVTAGYYRDVAATREAFRHGWFHSGDSCAYDEDGLQIMVDRFKDIVKTGGENVSSLRVESVLAQHPAVERAVVIGLPDPRWGELVTGVVVLASGPTPAETELIAFCRERLAGYETPKRIVVLDELPQTVGGKILKYRLRERLTAREKR